MNKNDLIQELNKVLEVAKKYNRFILVFSPDKAKKTLANLNHTISKIIMMLKMATIKEVEHPKEKPIRDGRGGLVKIRPCGKEYGDKTYLGFLIGDVALGSSIKIEDEKIVCERSGYNPGIYVPELDKVIYGCESWWSKIKSEEELKEITNENIENTWYVKLLQRTPK